MVGTLAPMGASILFCFLEKPFNYTLCAKTKKILWTAGIGITETARTIRSEKPCEGKKITRKSQGNFRVVRLEKWQTNLNLHYRARMNCWYGFVNRRYYRFLKTFWSLRYCRCCLTGQHPIFCMPVLFPIPQFVTDCCGICN